MSGDKLIACPSCGAPCDVDETAATEVWVNDEFGNPHLETRLGLKRYRCTSTTTELVEALREIAEPIPAEFEARGDPESGRVSKFYKAGRFDHAQAIARKALTLHDRGVRDQ